MQDNIECVASIPTEQFDLSFILTCIHIEDIVEIGSKKSKPYIFMQNALQV